MRSQSLPANARKKLDLMFHGVRYSAALGAAAEDAYPNYFPYRFGPDEPDPTGRGHAAIPYLLSTSDGTTLRVKGDGQSSWFVEGDKTDGYRLCHDRGDDEPVSFVARPDWLRANASDGTPLAQTGVSLHWDMAVVNVAPGCQYFMAEKPDESSLRCSFCTYGAPDRRMAALGQTLDVVDLPDYTYRRLKDALSAMLDEGGVGTIYLVGGSMRDPAQEGRRFIELARQVQQVVDRRVPVSCGSGALPLESLRILHDEQLVQNICFNLEVWSEPLFRTVCPGKHRYVGYGQWLGALENAVTLWGAGHVYSAMVAGIELEPEHRLEWQEAADLAIEGANDLCGRGILPTYSLYWPVGGRDHPHYMDNLHAYFERLNLGYRQVREERGLRLSPQFVTHRSAYMQLECDIDRALDGKL